jgi:pantoate--beta-alanine ligase
MQIFEQIAALRAQIGDWKAQGLSIGFVPTMGNLHDGHLSLVKMARERCDKVVASIFVNPLQFGPNEDFERYPRTFEDDCLKLQLASSDALFYPTVAEMYPNPQTQTRVVVAEDIAAVFEGATRPGHFDGVATVVSKLFNIVQPDVAIFGQKDFQQFAVIERMVNDLAMPITLIRAPIARDVDGLALSSRNQYLSAQQRQIAPKLYVVLNDIAQALSSGNRNFSDLENAATEQLLREGFDQVDYIRVVDPQTLAPASFDQHKFAILAVARLGSTRLLDNILIPAA